MRISQAILLCGGAGSKLYPLNSTGVPKVLLPVANQPLLLYPLRVLEEAGVKDVLVIVSGEATAQKVQSWVTKSYQGTLHLQVKSTAEGSDTADALRAVPDKIREKHEHLLVMSGDLVTDIPLKTFIASHFVTGAVASCLLTPTRTSPASQTKPGSSPRGVDYIGLDPHRNRIIFADSSPEVKRDIRVSAATLRQYPRISIRTDISDQHLYIFKSAAISHILEAKPNIKSIKQQLFPYLVRQQFTRTGAAGGAGMGEAAAKTLSQSLSGALSGSLQDLDMKQLSASSIPLPGEHLPARSWWCNGYHAPANSYCARSNTVSAYLEVNRDVVAPDLAPRLLEVKVVPRLENFVHDSVVLGNKATVSAGCMVGQGSTIGDKSSIKRSVLGRSCKVGNNVKIINSVIMDNVVIENGCQVQNSIICSGVRLQERVSLRDCQVGADYTVAEGSDLRSEELAKTKRPSGEMSR
eukprot:jgi/Botrbrau1/21442/Bobra.0216s0050.1